MITKIRSFRARLAALMIPLAANSALAAGAVVAYGVVLPDAAQAMCRAYGPQPGVYHNVDPNTREITRFVLDYRCNDTIALPVDATPAEREAARRRIGAHWTVRLWGQCHPHDCDWGTTAARSMPVGGVENLLASYDQGFAKRRVVLRKQGGRVQLILTSRYDDGRPPRKTSSFFTRVGG